MATPAVWLREWGRGTGHVISPMPASPKQVFSCPPAALMIDAESSTSARLIIRALALSPQPMPSAMPAASAIIFFWLRHWLEKKTPRRGPPGPPPPGRGPPPPPPPHPGKGIALGGAKTTSTGHYSLPVRLAPALRQQDPRQHLVSPRSRSVLAVGPKETFTSCPFFCSSLASAMPPPAPLPSTSDIILPHLPAPGGSFLLFILSVRGAGRSLAPRPGWGLRGAPAPVVLPPGCTPCLGPREFPARHKFCSLPRGPAATMFSGAPTGSAASSPAAPPTGNTGSTACPWHHSATAGGQPSADNGTKRNASAAHRHPHRITSGTSRMGYTAPRWPPPC